MPLNTEEKRRQISLSATSEYHEWLEEFAKSEGDTLSGLIRTAVREYARLREHSLPPRATKTPHGA